MLSNDTQQGKNFDVVEILGNQQAIKASGTTLTQEGLILNTPSEVLATNRYLWLEFGLPDSKEKIKALAEIIERSPFQTKVRFKHIFPDQRKKLNEYLTANISMN